MHLEGGSAWGIDRSLEAISRAEEMESVLLPALLSIQDYIQSMPDRTDARHEGRAAQLHKWAVELVSNTSLRKA